MLRSFIKEMISINVPGPANVTLPLKYFKQNFSPLSIPFYGNIDYTAKQIKIAKKSRKTINSSFLSGYSRFYEVI